MKITDLTIDPEIQLQSRGIDQSMVLCYVEALSNGAKFPPVVAYREDGHVWLADGFHRVEATRRVGSETIDAEIRDGTRQDAMVHAATANAEHGKPMSRAEKQEAGLRLLQMTDWSQERIAKTLAVATGTVSGWKSTLQIRRVEIVGQDGRQYNTANIGRQAVDDPAPARQDTIVRCPTCGNLYDSAVFGAGCPYCFKRANNITGWMDGLPEMMEQRSQVDYIPPPTTGASQQVEVTMFSHKSVEYYTPVQYIEAAREVMGGIDLDPASCADAQEVVQAGAYYTQEDDGLLQEWQGRVWLNPPYSYRDGQSNQELWSQALAEKYQAGQVTEAIMLVKAALGYNWFERLWYKWPVCFGRERLSFVKGDGTDDGQSKQASAFFYFGPNVDRFRQVFKRFGRVILPEWE